MTLQEWAEAKAFVGFTPKQCSELNLKGYGIGFATKKGAEEVAEEVKSLGIETELMQYKGTGGWYVVEKPSNQEIEGPV